MSGRFGADFRQSFTAADLAASGKGFSVNDGYADSSGNEYIFVSAATAITGAGFVCRISSAGTADMISTSNDARGERVGVALYPLAAGEFGWLQTNGVFANIQTLASCAANTRLNTTATAGALDDDGTVGSFAIDHIVLTTARPASQGNSPGVAANNAAVGAVL
jgi:hypothetical protein